MKSVLKAGDIIGKKVLVRVDWNVPFIDGEVADDFRIKKSLPTIEYLRNAGAKILIATHLEHGSIKALQTFVPEGAELLENLRENAGEEANTEEFAKMLASQADIYVNEAFGVSHREHAS